jgi:hypothetical protein
MGSGVLCWLTQIHINSGTWIRPCPGPGGLGYQLVAPEAMHAIAGDTLISKAAIMARAGPGEQARTGS